jgi:hypothetical protein
MPPRWNEYRTVIGRNGFVLVRSKDHETWVKYDDEGNLVRQTRASHGNAAIRDKGFFKELLRQCGKTEDHFYEVLKRRSKARPRAASDQLPEEPSDE